MPLERENAYGKIITGRGAVLGGDGHPRGACPARQAPADKLLGLDKLTDALKCQLRHDMLHTYYRHREDKTIRQYEMEDFLLLYRGYKALGGNSFIDRIKSEIDEWEVVS